jgi:hypothetical protein
MSRPSSSAGISTVTLSVSISRIVSPRRNESPGFFNHDAMRPLSMVSPMRGMVRVAVIGAPCG